MKIAKQEGVIVEDQMFELVFEFLVIGEEFEFVHDAKEVFVDMIEVIFNEFVDDDDVFIVDG